MWEWHVRSDVAYKWNTEVCQNVQCYCEFATTCCQVSTIHRHAAESLWRGVWKRYLSCWRKLENNKAIQHRRNMLYVGILWWFKYNTKSQHHCIFIITTCFGPFFMFKNQFLTCWLMLRSLFNVSCKNFIIWTFFIILN
jgi:hypothetical protein